jgi:hypothetical protein
MTPSQEAASCRPCAHRSRHMTCLEPVKAGLADSFVIVWAPSGYAKKCPAFEVRAKR